MLFFSKTNRMENIFMKKSIIIVLCLVIYICMPITSYAQNLIRNGSFNEIDDKGEIVNWGRPENEYCRVKVLDDALSIENTVTSYSEVSQMVKVKPNKYYKFSAKVKILRESNSGAYLSVKVFSDFIKSKTKIVKDKSDDYETIVMYGKTEAGQYSVTVNLCLGEDRTADRGAPACRSQLPIRRGMPQSRIQSVPDGLPGLRVPRHPVGIQETFRRSASQPPTPDSRRRVRIQSDPSPPCPR